METLRKLLQKHILRGLLRPLPEGPQGHHGTKRGIGFVSTDRDSAPVSPAGGTWTVIDTGIELGVELDAAAATERSDVEARGDLQPQPHGDALPAFQEHRRVHHRLLDGLVRPPDVHGPKPQRRAERQPLPHRVFVRADVGHGAEQESHQQSVVAQEASVQRR